MLVITNRVLSKDFAKTGVGGEKSFGEQLNTKGSNEIRLANVRREQGRWIVELVKEPKALTKKNLPSRIQFQNIFFRCKENNKNCLFYVHGYNKPFEKTLEQGWSLQERYNLEVVLFSWPSNPGGFPTDEYRNVKRIACASTGALDSSFEKLSGFIQMPFDKDVLLGCKISLNLMVYSMGNFMFQRYIEGSIYNNETRMFSNVVLCQADCDNKWHERWVDRIHAGKQIYITINENDKILGWSDFNFQEDRLGRTVRNLISANAIYVDFSEGKNIGNTHRLWEMGTNDTVKGFFRKVLNGERGETTTGLTYDSRVNAFRMV